MKKKIAVGLSGGIDSSFAAYILQKKGYEVAGFTLKFYPEDNRCCDLDSLYQAKRLCHKLGLPHFVFDVKDIFDKQIVDYFVDSYLKGLTPNPCSYCNRNIKFGHLFQKIKSLGFDFLSTGHYARIIKHAGNYLLRQAKDKFKSQEYFLALIKPPVLEHLVFPLGNYTKDEVEKIAKKEGLMFKERKESQDICFVKEKLYAKFIEKNSECADKFSGEIKHINGETLSRHKGIYYFTYGKRHGLGISWKEPLYVIGINDSDNTVIVGEKNHLYRKNFTVSSLNWFIDAGKLFSKTKKQKNLRVKIRYNSQFYKCRAALGRDNVRVELFDAAYAVTPGQIAVFYDKDIVLGGGVIEKYNLKD